MEVGMAKNTADNKPNKLENQALAYENIAFDSEKFLQAGNDEQLEKAQAKANRDDSTIDLDSFSEQQREIDLTNKKLVILQVIDALPGIKLAKLRDICLQSIYLNYFTFIACLDELVQNKIIFCQGDSYTLTKNGQKIFASLALTLPTAARQLINQLIKANK